MSESAESTGKDASAGYRVLARSYRPSNFDALIGQDAMVRTLTNAFESGRLAHAFVLTGVRGVGKTTTARIIARALNCIGPDGKGGPTITPCGVCDMCRSIAEDRLVDVIEMDAASNTGVDNMRELIDGVRYRPVAARYKVYIIDEVHMLSKGAFNALLKTLEEPPAHVKFIFATTEIRKVPVTVLSRCQRFDLRRVDVETLMKYFASVAEREGAKVEEGAIRVIARAADGSVRDGMSLLDQAIAVGAGEGKILAEDAVRDMLGLADRARSFDIFERVMGGDAPGAIKALAEDYAAGADPLILLQDVLDVIHWVTRLKVAPSAADDPMVAELDRTRGKALAEKLSMGELTRAWQMLLKGVREAASAPAPLQAAEMILIRLAYLTDLPTPADAAKAIAGAPAPSAPAPSSSRGSSAPAASASLSSPQPRAAMPQGAPTAMARLADAHPSVQAAPQVEIRSFADIIALTEQHCEQVLRAELMRAVHLVSFQPGHLEIRLAEGAPRDLPNRISRFLSNTSGARWMVTVAQSGGADTIGQQMDAQARDKREEVKRHPLVQSILEAFPGAELE
jgi:DNA polymerase-3 subunit gamma/tau